MFSPNNSSLKKILDIESGFPYFEMGICPVSVLTDPSFHKMTSTPNYDAVYSGFDRADLSRLAKNVLRAMGKPEAAEMIPQLPDFEKSAIDLQSSIDVVRDLDDATPEYPWEKDLAWACGRICAMLETSSAVGVRILIVCGNDIDLDVFSKLKDELLDIGADSLLEAYDAGVPIEDIVI